jgi:putative toxin-antitoxin system antitoxin component (TIGR02293 family)
MLNVASVFSATDAVGLGGQWPLYRVRMAEEVRVSSPTSTLDVVAGVAVIGDEVGSGMDLVRLIRCGLPIGAVQFILDSGRLTPAELDEIVLPRKTLANRRRLGTLTPEQSGRLVRVARVLAAAEEAFGSRDKAGAWLRRPTTALHGERPLHLLDTDEGAREVETLLGHIEHGIAA